MDQRPIYLDYNATTPVLPEVVDAMLPYLREHFGNPSSGHVYGQRSQSAVDRARQQVAGLIGCEASEIIFTSGGTEANNLAIRGVTEAREDRRAVVTPVSHDAMKSRLADAARRRLQEDVKRMTAEQRLAAFLEHCQLMTRLAHPDVTGQTPPRDAVSPNAR
jgi:cysteine desulfurase